MAGKILPARFYGLITVRLQGRFIIFYGLAGQLPKDFTMSTDPTQQRIDQIVKSSDVVLFMKGSAQFPMCGFSGRAIQVLKACGVTKPVTVNVLEDEAIRSGIKEYSNWPTIPQLYIKGEFVGGSDIMMEMYESGELQQMLGTSAA